MQMRGEPKQALEELVGSGGVGPRDLRTCTRRIHGLRSRDHAAFTNSLKADYLWDCRYIDHAQATGTYLGTYEAIEDPRRRQFKPDRTKRLLASYYRRMLPLIDCPGPEFNERREAAEKVPRSWEEALRGNSEAMMLFSIRVPRSTRLVEAQRRNLAALSLRAALLAIRAYEMETGRLPASLADLVPAYLPEVPRDEFDKNPIRYSREKRILYSVGIDGIDSFGEKGEDAGYVDIVLDIPLHR